MTPTWRQTTVRLVAAAALVFGLMMLVGAVLIHVLAHGWVGRTDDAIERSLLHSRTGLGNTLTDWGTQLAQPLTIEVALVVMVVALAIGTRRVTPPLFLAVTVGVESGIYFLVSTLEPRPRPSIQRLGIGDPVASYPSGHVAAAICFYGGLAVLACVLAHNRTLKTALVVLAVLIPPAVGLCRMYRGFHHLSDVLAGALLGLLWLTLTTWLILLPREGRARSGAPAEIPSSASAPVGARAD